MEPPIVTKDILNEFIRNYLKKRGHSWQPARPKPRRTRESDHQLFNDVCRCLDGASNELQEFIKGSCEDSFQSTTDIDLYELGSEQLRELADELFVDGTSWSTILTFLVHGAALCCKAIETRQNNPPEEAYKIVSKIIDCISEYIDENLLQWINEQDGGWLSVRDYIRRSVVTQGGVNSQPSRRSLKHHFGVAAFAVFVGGLYLCSRFSGH